MHLNDHSTLPGFSLCTACTMAIQAGLIRVQWPPPWPPSLILTSGDWEAPCSLTGDSNSWNYYQFSGWGYIGPNKTIKTKTILIKDFRIAHWHCMPSHSSSRTTRSHENFQKLLCLIYCSNNSDIAENAGLLSAPVRGYWPLIGWEWSRDSDTGLWLAECNGTWVEVRLKITKSATNLQVGDNKNRQNNSLEIRPERLLVWAELARVVVREHILASPVFPIYYLSWCFVSASVRGSAGAGLMISDSQCQWPVRNINTIYIYNIDKL